MKPPNPTAIAILAELATVDQHRVLRQADAALTERVLALKHYQARRFEHTYADLLGSERYRAAVRFFLEELYGPQEFASRDAQFARIVPSLVRLFPGAIVDTVHQLAKLHALSEAMDTQMAQALPRSGLQARDYLAAWQRCGQPEVRQRQIALVMDIGQRLDTLTRKPFLRATLRAMRGPANAAGLGDLQRFLESGFDGFAQLRGADEFLATLRERETRLADALFGVPAAQADLSLVPWSELP